MNHHCNYLGQQETIRSFPQENKAIDPYFSEVMLETNYTGIVPLKLHITNYSYVLLETFYKDTFIKVIDGNNLNSNIVYPISYLLTKPSIVSFPQNKNYCHDIIFNVYNYLHFLDVNNIIFDYSNILVVANIPGLDNAFWNGSYLVFGAGIWPHNPLTSSMIVGHELTHALIEKTCGLEYKNQSGALNEAICDIFGVSLEFFINNTFSSIGFKLGSECNFLLRNMEAPNSCNQPEFMYDRFYVPENSPNDNGGVHTNSGIINHIYFKIQEIIGHENAFKLFALILTKLSKNSNFQHFKHIMLLNNSLMAKDKLNEILDRHIFP